VTGQTLQRAEDAQEALAHVLKQGLAAEDAEAALAGVTGHVVELLGDKTAHLRPGGLKEGERQYAVSAVVLISPDRAHNVFLAQQNFPPEQIDMRIAIGHGHPGAVAASGRPLLLGNTDDHADFEQVLSTSRMGSAIYAPFHWRGQMLGQLICGAQARYTYRPVDLDVLGAFADTACALWVAHRGPDQFPEIADPQR
jgi:hypothetical protein